MSMHSSFQDALPINVKLTLLDFDSNILEMKIVFQEQKLKLIFLIKYGLNNIARINYLMYKVTL